MTVKKRTSLPGKLPRKFILATLLGINEVQAGKTKPYIFGRRLRAKLLKRAVMKKRQPGSLKGKIVIADDFNAPLEFIEKAKIELR
jgi:hypothetical protein